MTLFETNNCSHRTLYRQKKKSLWEKTIKIRMEGQLIWEEKKCHSTHRPRTNKNLMAPQFPFYSIFLQSGKCVFSVFPLKGNPFKFHWNVNTGLLEGFSIMFHSHSLRGKRMSSFLYMEPEIASSTKFELLLWRFLYRMQFRLRYILNGWYIYFFLLLFLPGTLGSAVMVRVIT